MADLSDFLGHILEELTRARVQADLETIRTAKLYAGDDQGLMKNFPIPRMRLPNIEITLPVVIDDTPDGYIERTDPAELNKILVADIQKVLKEQKVEIAINEITSLLESDDQLSMGHIRPLSTDLLVSRISGKIQASSRRTAAVHEKVVEEIRKQLDKTLSALPRRPVGISINPRSAAVKEFSQTADRAASVVYIKLSITEDALSMDLDLTHEKPVVTRLIPE
jgi:hypothetical protein